MLAIYNESRTPWEMEKINDSVLRLKKTKSRDHGGETKIRTASIISYAPLFENLSRLKYLLTTIRESQNPTIITDKDSAMVFNKKEFKPFITERGTNFKDVLMGSLFLQGKKVIGIKNKDTFLLEFFLHGGEFTFITSFNTKEANFIVELWDEKSGKIVEYSFQYKEGKIKLHKTETPTVNKNPWTKQIRVFRPSRPTYMILVHPKDLKELQATVNTDYHDVRVYTNIHDEIQKLKAENYKAVTLFDKSEWNQSTDEEKMRYNYLIDILKKEFLVVFRLHKGGKVVKQKY